ncbi:class II fumarate hydratase [Pleionea sediminis]|uniref:class II fumarate hydratase n=1 Tax=Pleionea sediminis TaxID=2569479 RepID=UPI001184C928|nr:class II fumarate hydratase [Pleionea sediminis]
MAKMRIEKDSLGSIKVPHDALYGAQTQRAIENFDYLSRAMPDGFITALAQVKKAAAKANKTLGGLSEIHEQLIISACDKILGNEAIRNESFPVSVFQTGSGTSTNMNMNEVIATLANQSAKKNDELIHPNDHVNFGQSSNDVIPTTIQLASLVLIVEHLLPAIEQLDKKISSLEERFNRVIKTGRTHLMDAMPIFLSDEFATWRFQICESRERIVSSLSRLSEIPLGGTAIGTGINRHENFPETVADELSQQFELPIKPCSNLASRIASQDPSLEIHGQLKVLATVLMKISNDIRWMNSGPISGLGEIQLKALQPGSSIMPGKVNPVIPESIAMMCAEIIGNDATITLANQSGNFQLNVMFPLIADKLISSILLLSSGILSLANKTLSHFEVNESSLNERLFKNPVLVTALNTKVGYEKAAEIAKVAQSEGRSIIDVAQSLTSLSEEQLRELLTPERLARPFDKKYSD